MKNVIQTEQLNFSYSKSKLDIQDLNLVVPTGSIYGFLGPNGSGKTTTIRLLLGLLSAKSGNVSVFGKSFQENRNEILQNVGALIETPSLYGHLTARENLSITSNYFGIDDNHRIEEVLEIVKLDNVGNKKVKAFSLGMKQRLGLANCLLHKPKLLILDEPTNGLDPNGIIEMRNLIIKLNKEFDTTIFISSHLLSEIEKTCTHVGVIKNGKILFQDSVSKLKNYRNKTLDIEIETNSSTRSLEALEKNTIEVRILNEKVLVASIEHKNEVPNLIRELNSQNIDIYQLKIKDNLEDIFLSLTEN